MIIKKFQANTETEAIMLAQEELGKDAIVMNIKTVVPKGIYRLFKQKMVEVTAALDEPLPRVKKEPEKEVKYPDIIYDEPLLTDGTSMIEKKLNNLTSMLEQQMKEKLEPEQEKPEQEIPENNKNMSCIQLIYKQLLENEVDEKYANQVISEIEPTLKKDATVDHILSAIYQKIVLKLGRTETLEVGKKKTKYVFFIGSTGVGKTTTIAKLASSLKIDGKVKIALLAADTYRIAAVEQLQTYADILGIPLHILYAEQDLEGIKEQLKDFDLVLIDTAGRSHKNRQQQDELDHFLSLVKKEEREVYLVLSIVTKYSDLKRIVEVYSEITDYRLIFTKLDETNTIGNIFNIKMLTGAPLSYTTFGQNVPEDISKVDAQAIAKQLLGGNE